MHRVVFVPLHCHPLAVDVLWLPVPEPSVSLAGHPIVKLLLILLQSLVPFELDDLLCDEVVSSGRLSYHCSAQQVVVLRQGKVLL